MAQRRFYDEESDVTYYHIIARTTADRCDGQHYQLTDEMKSYLVKELKRFDQFYAIDLLAYCIMSTHLHLIIRRRKNALDGISCLDAAHSYQIFHKRERRIDARGKRCKRIRQRMNSISDYMGRFLQETSLVINYDNSWGGHLWRERFKSVLLADGKALSTCLKYVELNPVRAKMVKDPAVYRWSSWGERTAFGDWSLDSELPTGKEDKDKTERVKDTKHPYKRRIIESLRYFSKLSMDESSDQNIWDSYSYELRRLALCSSGTEAEMIALLSQASFEELLLPNPYLTKSHRLCLATKRRKSLTSPA